MGTGCHTRLKTRKADVYTELSTKVQFGMLGQTDSRNGHDLCILRLECASKPKFIASNVS